MSCPPASAPMVPALPPCSLALLALWSSAASLLTPKPPETRKPPKTEPRSITLSISAAQDTRIEGKANVDREDLLLYQLALEMVALRPATFVYGRSSQMGKAEVRRRRPRLFALPSHARKGAPPPHRRRRLPHLLAFPGWSTRRGSRWCWTASRCWIFWRNWST